MKTNFTHKKPFSVLNKILFTFCLLTLLNSCQTSTKEEVAEVPDSVALTAPVPEQLNSDQSALLKDALGSSSEGIIRGVAFGDAIAKVKATETFEMFEETPDHLGYTFETAKLETIDVQYFLTPEKKVNKIQIDVYLNSADATKQLWEAGKAHFTETYSAPKEESKELVWNKNSVKVQMLDVTKGKDFGLKFEFYPTNKNALAVK